jgi:hypothetical protein
MNWNAAAHGAGAGVAGSFAMHMFRLCWESATSHDPEQAIFGFDREADVNSARRLASTFVEQVMDPESAAKLGLALHYAYGAVVGSGYAVLSRRRAWMRLGFGTAFGAILWFAGDEVLISMAGLSRPFERKCISHVGALGSHLLFGVTLEALIGRQFRAN